MSFGVNKVILVGNIGSDVKESVLTNGGLVCNFSLCTEESWIDKITNEKKKLNEWHKIVAFNRLGETASKFCKKGDRIYIEGKIKTRKYLKNDIEMYAIEIVAREFAFMSKNNNKIESNKQNNMDDVFEGF